MGNISDQHDVIAFLSDPASYGESVGAIERCETHGSIVFLVGDRAYKLKRPVKFPYMDYSTVSRRKQMCLRELHINRDLAPMLYLEVRPIVRNGVGALRFGLEAESGKALDWVLVMRRFDQDALFERMRKAGKLTRPLVRRLAEIAADFHKRAEAAPGFGGAAGMRDVVDENTAILKAKVDHPFGADRVHRYQTEIGRALTEAGPLLDMRKDRGHVRRCHGDLHLNNICMIGEQPVLFDAIEFSDNFACIDVLYDLAFLLMDLDRHGLRNYANIVLNRYLELTEEHGGLAALPVFLSCRAAIRAHTEVAAAEALESASEREAKRQDAIGLLEHAIAYIAAPSPRLIAIGGISGTGKTTLANEIAPFVGNAPGAVVVRSDVIRKQIMGVSETTRLPESAYTPEVTQEVYSRISLLVPTILEAGYSAIADAVYGRESERQALAALAASAHVPFTGVWLDAPPELLESRIQSRVGDASDATVGVMRAQLQFVSVPQDWKHVSAIESPVQTASAARRTLAF